MAYEGAQICIPGLKASADLSAKQYYFVKLSGAGTVTVCGPNGCSVQPAGIGHGGLIRRSLGLFR